MQCFLVGKIYHELITDLDQICKDITLKHKKDLYVMFSCALSLSLVVSRVRCDTCFDS